MRGFILLAVVKNMEYTQSQKEAIREFIIKHGYHVNEQGCEVWISTVDRAPYFQLQPEHGKKTHVNVRTFLWMDANGGSFVRDTHTSCGNTKCVKLAHILPGRKKLKRGVSKTPHEFTDTQITAFRDQIQNGVTVNESGCHLWGGAMLEKKYPSIPNTFDDGPRNLYISRFLWMQSNGNYNHNSKRLTKTCGEDSCVNIAHFQLVDKKEKFDRDHLWKLLIAKAEKQGNCLVMKKTTKGRGVTNLCGRTVYSHIASYIINKNGGQPVPSKDQHGNRLVIRHLCHRQPACINPDHLELGTQMVNAYEDKIDAGTLPRGEKHHNSKITESVAQKIKNSYRKANEAGYMTQRKRAEMYGTTVGIVNAIDQNSSWAHLPNRFGVIHPNADHRRKQRGKKRKGRTTSWSDQDFEKAGEKIKENTIESEKRKAGENPPGPCWEWQQSKTSTEYGATSFKNRATMAHILSLESKHKRFHAPGEVVRHRCANPICVAPHHLVFGTVKENSEDVMLYGSSKNFKLDHGTIRQIRASNASSATVAEELGIHPRTVSNVRSGKSWSIVE